MLKKLIILGGVLLFILPVIVNADLNLRLYVDSSYALNIANNANKLEQDAYGYAKILWTSAGAYQIVALDGSVDYATSIFEYTDGSNPSYLNGQIYATYLDSNDYDATYGTEVISSVTYGISKVSLLAVANPYWSTSAAEYWAYTLKLQVRAAAAAGSTSLLFRDGFAKVLDNGGIDRTGTANDYALTITTANPPGNFTGPSSVTDLQTGNTVTVAWTDLNSDGASGFTNDDTPPIYYDIYYSTASFSNPESETYLGSGLSNLSGASKTIGSNGIAGTPALSDGVPYYFRMRAKDSTTDKDTIGRHKTTNTDSASTYIKSVIPTDHTAPSAPTGFSAAASDGSLLLSWSQPSSYYNDLAGYVLVRYTSAPTAAPTLVGAAAKDTDNDGAEDGDEYPAGTVISGGTVIYNGSRTSYTDSGLTNGQTYYYYVFAYDTVSRTTEPYQQGRNYSNALSGSGTPGVAPSDVSHLRAVSGTGYGQITLYWDNPTAGYGGSRVSYCTNPGTDYVYWERMGPASAESLSAIYQYQDVSSPSSGLVLSSLTTSETYYFKVFAYNEAVSADNRQYAEGVAVAAVPQSGGVVAQSAPLTFESQVPAGPGINSFSMPIASPWYAYDSAGSAIYVDGTSNQIENAYDLVVAINGGTAATNVVSNFGYWNSAGQSISGVMISDLATARTELEAINILPGVGYQVYVSSSKSLVISNQMP